MQLNPLAIAIGAVLVCGIGVMTFGHKSDAPVNVSIQSKAPELAKPDPAAEKPTTNEDVATLIATFKVQQEKSAALEKEVKELKQINERQTFKDNTDSSSMVESVVARLNETGALSVDKSINAKVTELENQIRKFAHKPLVDHPSYLDGDKHDDETTAMGDGFSDTSVWSKTKNKQALKLTLGEQKQLGGWVLPEDADLVEGQGNQDPTVSFSVSKDKIFKQNTGNTLYVPPVVDKDSNGNAINKKIEDHITRMGTIPQDSTLMGSVTMTALLGRIPIKGKLIDPFEFKVLVGSQNLASNGIYIPHLKSMVLSGIAKGNYTGQCVSGDIISGTYTFDDGRIQSFTQGSLDDKGAGGEFESAGMVSASRIGWISTPTGIPCLSGKYISDAPSFIALQGGLATLNGLANGFKEAATEVTGEGEKRSAAVVKPGQFAAGTAVGAGVTSASKWIEEIRQTAFAMVYVKPNQPIAVNISRSIPIDYHSIARKVSYSNNWGINKNEQNLD